MKDNEASSTAYSVLQGLLHVGRQPRYQGLVPEESVAVGQEILMATEEGRRRLRQLDRAVFKMLIPVMEALLVPGLTLHYALRKRFIEDTTLKELADGKTQVVNLGAGFDTLIWRLSERRPDITFIEIDHPATSAAKAAALGAVSAQRPNVHMVEVDFTRQTLMDQLSAAPGFAPDRPTLFICEGVLTYLTEDQVGELLGTLIALTQSPPTFVCTCVEPMEVPDNNTGPLLGLYLRMKGEEIKWRIRHQAVAEFMARHHFSVDRIVTHRDFKKAYLDGIDHGTIHGGEYGVVARATP